MMRSSSSKSKPDRVTVLSLLILLPKKRKSSPPEVSAPPSGALGAVEPSLAVTAWPYLAVARDDVVAAHDPAGAVLVRQAVGEVAGDGDVGRIRRHLDRRGVYRRLRHLRVDTHVVVADDELVDVLDGDADRVARGDLVVLDQDVLVLERGLAADDFVADQDPVHPRLVALEHVVADHHVGGRLGGVGAPELDQVLVDALRRGLHVVQVVVLDARPDHLGEGQPHVVAAHHETGDIEEARAAQELGEVSTVICEDRIPRSPMPLP
jgi:hypothetical protein